MDAKCYYCTNVCNQTVNRVFSQGVAASKI